MKILHISHYESRGGAAIAAKRLHEGLVKKGVDSYFWSVESTLDGPLSFKPSKWNLYLRFRLSQALLILLFRRYRLKAFNILPNYSLRHAVRTSDFDIIHLHWISGDLMSISDIVRFRKPVVITLHDQWYINGVDHLIETDYIEDIFSRASLLENLLRKYKLRSLNSIRAGLIAPSKWMLRGIKVSSRNNYQLCRQIFNVIDLEVFNSQSRKGATRRILIGSFGGHSADHKGFEYILSMLRDNLDYFKASDLQILSFGESNQLLDLFGLNISYLGNVNDEHDMAAIYNSASCLILPSLIDNLPSMAIEAIACGTPVIAFEVGGVNNVVQDGVNGVLVPKRNISVLFTGVKSVLEGEISFDLAQMRKSVEKFSYEIVTQHHLEFYANVALNYGES